MMHLKTSSAAVAFSGPSGDCEKKDLKEESHSQESNIAFKMKNAPTEESNERETSFTFAVSARTSFFRQPKAGFSGFWNLWKSRVTMEILFQ